MDETAGTISKRADLTTANKEEQDELNEELDADETLVERLVGLTEMFPQSVRDATCALISLGAAATVVGYKYTRILTFTIASGALILISPVIVESTRADMAKQNISKQQQILLGPKAAISRSTFH